MKEGDDVVVMHLGGPCLGVVLCESTAKSGGPGYAVRVVTLFGEQDLVYPAHMVHLNGVQRDEPPTAGDVKGGGT